jgi:hypothetical protein
MAGSYGDAAAMHVFHVPVRDCKPVGANRHNRSFGKAMLKRSDHLTKLLSAA